MPNMLTTEYAQAIAEAARRAAEERARRERERRRAKIKEKINDWNGKLSDVTSQISALENEKGKLEGYMGEWEMQKSKYNGSDILSEVVIVNTFEGVCADKIKKDFTACMAEMDQTYRKVYELAEDVNMQIIKLNQYITFIKTRLTYLTRELNSI